MNVGKIMNFGGKIKPVNCGPENEYGALYSAYYDMLMAAKKEGGFMKKMTKINGRFFPYKVNKNNDLYLALRKNQENL